MAESQSPYRKSTFRVITEKVARLPKPVRSKALNLVVGHAVKFVGTSGIEIEVLEPEMVHLKLANRKKVQNHIGGIHAAAMALLAESATGLIVGLCVSKDSLPVLKSMKIDYKKRASGDMEAVARLTPEQITMLGHTPKGNLVVPVVVTDSRQIEPIHVEMEWAWIPVKKKVAV